MKKILLLLLLIPSFAYAVDVTQVSGPDNIFGGGVQEGSDVGFGNITATRIDATTGVLDNITALTAQFPVGGTSARPTICFGDCDTGFYEIGDDNISFVILSLEQIRLGTSAFFGTTNGNFSINHSQIASFTSPVYSFTGDPNTGINSGISDSLSIITGGVESIRFNNDSSVFYTTGTNQVRIYEDGSITIEGGIKTSFRNLSSASETITTADYFITCLANDNEVTFNLPPVDPDTSQTLMIKYTDSGSTNKCKLDGNASEQVEGFDVYSGLDTYKEGIILKSDGSSWWIMGGV